MKPTKITFEIYNDLLDKMNWLGKFMMFIGYFSIGIDGAIINGLIIQEKRLFIKKDVEYTKCI